MAGNSWQSPTSGEPSWGTMHSLTTPFSFTTGASPTATTQQFTATSSGGFPAGIKALHLTVNYVAAAGNVMSVRDLSSGIWIPIKAQAAGTAFLTAGPVPVSSTGGFKVVTGSTLDTNSIQAMGYYL